MEIEFIAYTCELWNKKCIKVQQEVKLNDIPHNVQIIKTKVVYCCVGRLWKQYSSRKDNNANGVDEIASMLWDIIVSWESKNIWQMAKETWVDGFGLVSIMA